MPCQIRVCNLTRRIRWKSPVPCLLRKLIPDSQAMAVGNSMHASRKQVVRPARFDRVRWGCFFDRNPCVGLSQNTEIPKSVVHRSSLTSVHLLKSPGKQTYFQRRIPFKTNTGKSTLHLGVAQKWGGRKAKGTPVNRKVDQNPRDPSCLAAAWRRLVAVAPGAHGSQVPAQRPIWMFWVWLLKWFWFEVPAPSGNLKDTK